MGVAQLHQGNAMRQWKLRAERNENDHRYADALRKSPVICAVSVQGKWMPVVPGETKIPKVKHAT